jgi:hypothetical protein
MEVNYHHIEEDRKYTYHVTLWRVCLTIVECLNTTMNPFCVVSIYISLKNALGRFYVASNNEMYLDSHLKLSITLPYS